MPDVNCFQAKIRQIAYSASALEGYQQPAYSTGHFLLDSSGKSGVNLHLNVSPVTAGTQRDGTKRRGKPLNEEKQSVSDLRQHVHFAAGKYVNG